MIYIYGLFYPASKSTPVQICTNFELAYTCKEFQQFEVIQENEQTL